MSIATELYPEQGWHKHAEITGAYTRVKFLTPERGSWRPWWLWWTFIPGLEQCLFFLLNNVPLDSRAWAIHTDVVVKVAGRGQFDLCRSNEGVTCVPHEAMPDMIAMEQFEVPIGHTVTFDVLVDLLNAERKKPYRLVWNNCHGFAFKVATVLHAPHTIDDNRDWYAFVVRTLLRAPDTHNFLGFYRYLRTDFRWKYCNPMDKE